MVLLAQLSFRVWNSWEAF